ncbi:MAG: transglycosylase SLT domain-containing protein [Candidatus Binatia bacterium]
MRFFFTFFAVFLLSGIPAPFVLQPSIAQDERSAAYRIDISPTHVENPGVANFLRTLTGRERATLQGALARAATYRPAMSQIFREEDLPEDLLNLCVIESEFLPHARSEADASGLWQFTRATGLRYGLKINSWIDERHDPIKSTRAAAAYLRDLHTQFREWLLVVAAFNAGEGSVKSALNRLSKKSFSLLSARPFLKPKTQDFVDRFVATTLISRKPESHGFREIVYEPELEFDEVVITQPLSLDRIAALADTSRETVQRLNPALLRDRTPPQEEPFVLRLPSGGAERFYFAYRALPELSKGTVSRHQVKAGESLWQIARRYGMTVWRLMEINGLEGARLKIGQELIVAPGTES